MLNVYFKDVEKLKVESGVDGRPRIRIFAHETTVSLDRATLAAALRKLDGDAPRVVEAVRS